MGYILDAKASFYKEFIRPQLVRSLNPTCRGLQYVNLHPDCKLCKSINWDRLCCAGPENTCKYTRRLIRWLHHGRGCHNWIHITDPENILKEEQLPVPDPMALTVNLNIKYLLYIQRIVGYPMVVTFPSYTPDMTEQLYTVYPYYLFNAVLHVITPWLRTRFKDSSSNEGFVFEYMQYIESFKFEEFIYLCAFFVARSCGVPTCQPPVTNPFLAQMCKRLHRRILGIAAEFHEEFILTKHICSIRICMAYMIEISRCLEVCGFQAFGCNTDSVNIVPFYETDGCGIDWMDRVFSCSTD